MAIADKLTYLDGTKTLIADALASKGQDVSASTFREYATAIGNITGETTSTTTSTLDTHDIFGDGSCIATYQLNGDATDLGGNYNGTASGVTYDIGKFGQGASFNGTSSYVATGIILPSLGAYSVSFFFKATNTGKSYALIADGDGADVNTRIGITIRDNGLLGISSANGSSSFFDESVDFNSFLDNSFHHCVVVYVGTSIFVYIDGSLFHTYNSTVSVVGNGSHQIVMGRFGSYAGTSTTFQNYLNGSIDQVRIFNRALTADEVYQLYTQGQTLPQPTTDGLVAYYPLTGTAEDKAGTYDGTENGVDYVVDAERGSVASFDGSSSYIRSTLGNTLSQFSVSIWFKSINSVSSNNQLFDISYDQSVSTSQNTIFFSTGGLLYLSNNDGLGGYITTSSSPYLDGTWHHAVAIFVPSDRIELYIDNVLIGTSTCSETLYSQYLTIGARDDRGNDGDTDNFYDGSISNLRIYDRALTAEEITTIYNYELTNHPIAVSDGLVAYYPLKENSMDNWANEYDGTDNGVTYDGQSASFDGSSSYINTNNPTNYTDFSISLFFKHETGSGNDGDTIISKGAYYAPSYDAFPFSASIEEATSQLVVSYSSGGDYSIDLEQRINIQNSLWTHLVIIYKRDGNSSVYINGEQKDTDASVNITSTEYNWTIGRSAYPYSGGVNETEFNGSIGNVRIYNRTLTEEEITDIYNSERMEFGL